jgi:glyoxylase-like metal-dependent hydrolase (beta-lactamase superfamily II)
VFALGGSVPADRRLSWFPEGRTGWLPINCYLLRDKERFLLIDTGVTPHWESIRADIDTLTMGCIGRAAVVTRREPDSMINLPAAVGTFAIETVYAGGGLSPLDFFDGLDEANGIAQIRAGSGVSPAMLQPRAVIRVGSLEVEVLPSPLRVLFTNWLYERTTKTMRRSRRSALSRIWILNSTGCAALIPPP